MLNRIVLVGRLTKNPELRYTPAGDAVCSFTIAVNRNFKNKQTGEQEADFLNIIVWRKQGENAANYLKKGSLAGVDGRIQTRNYEGQDGKRVYITEIVAESVQFLDTRGSGGDNNQSNTNTGGNSNNGGNSQQSGDNGYQSKTQNNSYTDDPFSGNDSDIDDSLPF